MTLPLPCVPVYEIEFPVGGSRVSVVKNDARSAVETLRECARLHGEAVLSSRGQPILVDRADPSRVEATK